MAQDDVDDVLVLACPAVVRMQARPLIRLLRRRRYAVRRGRGPSTLSSSCSGDFETRSLPKHGSE